MPNDYFVTKHCISLGNKRIYSKSNSNSESAYALGKIKYRLIAQSILIQMLISLKMNYHFILSDFWSCSKNVFQCWGNLFLNSISPFENAL